MRYSSTVYSFGVSSISSPPRRDFARRLVQHEVADRERRRRERARPARERLDAREKLLEREWLRDVVVGAGAQCRHLRVDRVLRGEHEHGSLESASAKRVQHLEAGLSRKAHVEHDEIVGLGIRAPLPFLAVGHEIDGPPLLLEAAFYVLPDGRIILDDENAHDNKLARSSELAADPSS